MTERPPAERGAWRARVAVLVAALVVNVPVLGAGPIYDDHALVVGNSLTRAPIQWRTIFTTGYWSGTGIRAGNEYRPLTVLSFALADRLGVPGQRALNALLHGAVALLVGELGALIVGAPAAAWVAGLAFALHPVHADVLGTLVGRGELLAAALGLGAWWAHLVRRPRLAAAAVCAAFLAKESAVVVPALVLLGDLCRGDGKLDTRRWLELSLGLVLAIAIRVAVMGGVLAVESIAAVDNPLVALSTSGRVLSALASFAAAARLALFPVGLLPDRSTLVPVIRSVADWRWVPGLLLLAGALVAVVSAALGKRRARPWALALGGFVLAYLPVSNLVFLVGTALAERLLYVPSVAICLGLAWWMDRLPRTPRVAGCAALAVVLGVACVQAVWPYRSGLALWQRMVERAPTHAKARLNLVGELTAAGRLDEAERVARAGIAAEPSRSELHRALAETLAARGERAAAIAAAREAARLAPHDLETLLALAGQLYDAGLDADAAKVYGALCDAFPGAGEPWWYLSRIAERAGDRREALRAMRAAAARYGSRSEWGARAAAEAARLSGAAG
ncbi:MAG: tetratricopeptide repeat protein [bacterium]